MAIARAVVLGAIIATALSGCPPNTVTQCPPSPTAEACQSVYTSQYLLSPYGASVFMYPNGPRPVSYRPDVTCKTDYNAATNCFYVSRVGYGVTYVL